MERLIQSVFAIFGSQEQVEAYKRFDVEGCWNRPQEAVGAVVVWVPPSGTHESAPYQDAAAATAAAAEFLAEGEALGPGGYWGNLPLSPGRYTVLEMERFAAEQRVAALRQLLSREQSRLSEIRKQMWGVKI